jgi:hypothetical protein
MSAARSRGPNRPTKPSKFSAGKPASRTVGTLGSSGARLVLLKAISLALPACTCGRTIANAPQYIWMRPSARSVEACTVSR